MEITLTKIHGLGNDYLFIEDLAETLAETALPVLARKMSNRHLGVGADGIILVLPGREHRFRMRIFNADGSEAEMCGNGVRGFAKYVYERRLETESAFTVETKAGPVAIKVFPENGLVPWVQADLGPPRLSAEQIGLSAAAPADPQALTVRLDGREYPAAAVSMGNPHLIIFLPDLANLEAGHWGPILERHPLYPHRTNVGFVQVLGPTELKMVVWERGSGLTQACGTGAAAAVVAAAVTGRASRRAGVLLPGGRLEVEWTTADRILLSGPAEEVFTARYTFSQPEEG